MSRAVRRHPVVSKPPRKGGGGAAPRMPRPTTRPQRQGRGPLGFLRPPFVEDIVGELRKVTWPSRQDTMNLTFVVIVISVIVGLFLGGIDILFNWIIENTLLR